MKESEEEIAIRNTTRLHPKTPVHLEYTIDSKLSQGFQITRRHNMGDKTAK